MTEYVSRAGNKLKHALDHFQINVSDLVCADLGCSTGGFVDVLLQTGAAKVYAVDTAYGELAWKLRNDPRVKVMERTNALYADIPEPVDFVSIDVGWTRQELIVPKALTLLKSSGQIVSLLKPHYEADKKMLAKGKLKEEFVDEVIEMVLSKVKNLLLDKTELVGCCKSPVLGDKAGNKEYLIYIKKAA